MATIAGMAFPRRRLLTVGAAAGLSALAGCVPDPTITGAPQPVWTPSPTAPVQSPGAASASTAVARMQAWVQAASAASPTWTDAPAGSAESLARVEAQCTTHLDRLLALDPLVPDTERIFEVASPPSTAPSSHAEAAAALTAVVQQSEKELADAVAKATTQPERLLFASVAAATRAALVPALAGAESKASPIRFPDGAAEASVAVALTHVFALVNGLEVGLGRLPAKDPLLTAGTARLAQARQLRLDLRDAAAEPVEQEVAYELPTAMQTPADIRSGWGVLELRVLDALGRLVATGPPGKASTWLEPMLAQVAKVQGWGGTIPLWPGWVLP